MTRLNPNIKRILEGREKFSRKFKPSMVSGKILLLYEDLGKGKAVVRSAADS